MPNDLIRLIDSADPTAITLNNLRTKLIQALQKNGVFDKDAEAPRSFLPCKYSPNENALLSETLRQCDTLKTLVLTQFKGLQAQPFEISGTTSKELLEIFRHKLVGKLAIMTSPPLWLIDFFLKEFIAFFQCEYVSQEEFFKNTKLLKLFFTNHNEVFTSYVTYCREQHKAAKMDGEFSQDDISVAHQLLAKKLRQLRTCSQIKYDSILNQLFNELKLLAKNCHKSTRIYINTHFDSEEFTRNFPITKLIFTSQQLELVDIISRMHNNISVFADLTLIIKSHIPELAPKLRNYFHSLDQHTVWSESTIAQNLQDSTEATLQTMLIAALGIYQHELDYILSSLLIEMDSNILFVESIETLFRNPLLQALDETLHQVDNTHTICIYAYLISQFTLIARLCSRSEVSALPQTTQVNALTQAAQVFFETYTNATTNIINLKEILLQTGSLDPGLKNISAVKLQMESGSPARSRQATPPSTQQASRKIVIEFNKHVGNRCSLAADDRDISIAFQLLCYQDETGNWVAYNANYKKPLSEIKTHPKPLIIAEYDRYISTILRKNITKALLKADSIAAIWKVLANFAPLSSPSEFNNCYCELFRRAVSLAREQKIFPLDKISLTQTSPFIVLQEDEHPLPELVLCALAFPGYSEDRSKIARSTFNAEAKRFTTDPKRLLTNPNAALKDQIVDFYNKKDNQEREAAYALLLRLYASSAIEDVNDQTVLMLFIGRNSHLSPPPIQFDQVLNGLIFVDTPTDQASENALILFLKIIFKNRLTTDLFVFFNFILKDNEAKIALMIKSLAAALLLKKYSAEQLSFYFSSFVRKYHQESLFFKAIDLTLKNEQHASTQELANLDCNFNCIMRGIGDQILIKNIELLLVISCHLPLTQDYIFQRIWELFDSENRSAIESAISKNSGALIYSLISIDSPEATQIKTRQQTILKIIDIKKELMRSTETSDIDPPEDHQQRQRPLGSTAASYSYHVLCDLLTEQPLNEVSRVNIINFARNIALESDSAQPFNEFYAYIIYYFNTRLALLTGDIDRENSKLTFLTNIRSILSNLVAVDATLFSKIVYELLDVLYQSTENSDFKHVIIGVLYDQRRNLTRDTKLRLLQKALDDNESCLLALIFRTRPTDFNAELLPIAKQHQQVANSLSQAIIRLVEAHVEVVLRNEPVTSTETNVLTMAFDAIEKLTNDSELLSRFVQIAAVVANIIMLHDNRWLKQHFESLVKVTTSNLKAILALPIEKEKIVQYFNVLLADQGQIFLATVLVNSELPTLSLFFNFVREYRTSFTGETMPAFITAIRVITATDSVFESRKERLSELITHFATQEQGTFVTLANAIAARLGLDQNSASASMSGTASQETTTELQSQLRELISTTLCKNFVACQTRVPAPKLNELLTKLLFDFSEYKPFLSYLITAPSSMAAVIGYISANSGAIFSNARENRSRRDGTDITFADIIAHALKFHKYNHNEIDTLVSCALTLNNYDMNLSVDIIRLLIKQIEADITQKPLEESLCYQNLLLLLHSILEPGFVALSIPQLRACLFEDGINDILLLALLKCNASITHIADVVNFDNAYKQAPKKIASSLLLSSSLALIDEQAITFFNDKEFWIEYINQALARLATKEPKRNFENICTNLITVFRFFVKIVGNDLPNQAPLFINWFIQLSKIKTSYEVFGNLKDEFIETIISYCAQADLKPENVVITQKLNDFNFLIFLFAIDQEKYLLWSLAKKLPDPTTSKIWFYVKAIVNGYLPQETEEILKRDELLPPKCPLVNPITMCIDMSNFDFTEGNSKIDRTKTFTTASRGTGCESKIFPGSRYYNENIEHLCTETKELLRYIDSLFEFDSDDKKLSNRNHLARTHNTLNITDDLFLLRELLPISCGESGISYALILAFGFSALKCIPGTERWNKDSKLSFMQYTKSNCGVGGKLFVGEGFVFAIDDADNTQKEYQTFRYVLTEFIPSLPQLAQTPEQISALESRHSLELAVEYHDKELTFILLTYQLNYLFKNPQLAKPTHTNLTPKKPSEAEKSKYTSDPYDNAILLWELWARTFEACSINFDQNHTSCEAVREVYKRCWETTKEKIPAIQNLDLSVGINFSALQKSYDNRRTSRARTPSTRKRSLSAPANSLARRGAYQPVFAIASKTEDQQAIIVPADEHRSPRDGRKYSREEWAIGHTFSDSVVIINSRAGRRRSSSFSDASPHSKEYYQPASPRAVHPREESSMHFKLPANLSRLSCDGIANNLSKQSRGSSSSNESPATLTEQQPVSPVATYPNGSNRSPINNLEVTHALKHGLTDAGAGTSPYLAALSRTTNSIFARPHEGYSRTAEHGEVVFAGVNEDGDLIIQKDGAAFLRREADDTDDLDTEIAATHNTVPK